MSHPFSERLDAGESMFFTRELEHVDKEAYEQPLAPTKARGQVPQITGVPEWTPVYTWREYTMVGLAALISDEADDLPEAEVYGREQSAYIKAYGARYGYTVDEIKLASKTGAPLDRMRSRACWEAVDRKIDSVIATGDAKVGLTGILNVSGASTYTLSTKADGTKAWGTLAAPNATGKQVAADIMGIASAAHLASKEHVEKFRIRLPLADLQYAAQIPYGSASDVTALKFALANCPYIESIDSWERCKAAGAGGTSSRMAAWPVDPRLVGLLLTLDHERQSPVLKNYRYTVNERSKTGGVIARAPFLVHYADGLAL